MKEIWKPIEGYEGLYEISNFGNVKSLSNRTVKMHPEGKIMKPEISCKGYARVS